MFTSCSIWRHIAAMNRIRRFATVAVATWGGVAALASAQCLWGTKLTASDAARFERFGWSVSVSADTALVGAPHDECPAGLNCGSAYLYRFNGYSWVEEQKLTAHDGARDDSFGISVSVSGDTAVVGANLKDCAAGINCGAAYVYRFDGSSWVEEQKLTGSESVVYDRFGRSVSVSGDTVVVGARPFDCAAGRYCGTAYVLRFNGTSWVEEQKLTASDAAAGDMFGRSVSVSGNTAFVGAAHDRCCAGCDCGAVYVFRFNGTVWVEEQKLTGSDTVADGKFGFSVSVSGDTAVVGAPDDECAAGLKCGSAYMYRFNGSSWVVEQQLSGSDTVAYDAFGVSVSVSGNTAVVGAVGGGAAYRYRFNGSSWVEEQKLNGSGAGEYETFGISVSVSGDAVFVGEYLDECDVWPWQDYCGAAYVFRCVPPPIVVKLDIKPGSCPNPVNPKSKGVLPVAIVGSLDIDVATVDLDSLTLARTDGVGGSVAPLTGRRGGGIVIKDVATPLADEPCGCHELGGDGIDDLSLKFSTSELSSALELSELPRGETMELVLRGTLQDGRAFEAVDCIKIPGKHRKSHRPHRKGKPK